MLPNPSNIRKILVAVFCWLIGTVSVTAETAAERAAVPTASAETVKRDEAGAQRQEAACQDSDRKEIESLLHYIGAMEGASFVRNGQVHTPKEAEAHLRLKWTNQKSRIATAEDFIRLCGTKSSLSRKAYVIRFKDGHEEEAAVVLSKQLQVVRAASVPKNQDVPNK